MTTYYDNTRLTDHRNCNRLYYFRHDKGWAMEGTRPALVFGSSWHEAMDIVWKRIAGDRSKDIGAVIDEAYDAFMKRWLADGMSKLEDMTPDQIDKLAPRHPGTALNMISEYISNPDTGRLHFLEDISLISVEQAFAVPIFPDRDDVFYVGRLDKVYEDLRKDLWLGEHKTTTAYRKAGFFKMDFVESFSPNSQIDGYMYAASLMYDRKCKGVQVDAALVHKTVHNGFGFMPIIRSLASLDAWLFDARSEILKIEKNNEDLSLYKHDSSQHTGTHDPCMPSYPRNTTNCAGKYGLCSFIGVCKMIDNPETLDGPPVGIKEDRWEPYSFHKLDEIGMGKRDA